MILALNLLEKGDDLSSCMVTKNHGNIIKVLCTKLQWTEGHEEQHTNTEEPLVEKTDEFKEVTFYETEGTEHMNRQIF